jgi:hypothetical protein
MAIIDQDREKNIAQTEPRNQAGRAIAMTLANPIKPGRSAILRFNFWVSRHFPPLLTRLRKLSFIHFARWTILDEFPYNGPPQVREDTRLKYLFFISNYNGYWMQYIDSFYHVVRDQWDLIWGNTYYYPKGSPAGVTKRVISRLEYTASHYYSAYPEASATMVLSALALKQHFDEFHTEARRAGPEEFGRAYCRFMTDVQRYL